ncbi:MAG: hypothetical protein ACTH9V_08630 [Propionibacterium freudenreichii]
MADSARHDARRRAREQRRRKLRHDLHGLVSSSPIAGRTRASAGLLWRAPVWLITLLMAVVLVGVITFGSFRSTGRPAQPAITVSPSASPTPSVSQTPVVAPQTMAPTGEDLADLQAQVAAIENRYGVRVGLAVSGIAPVGAQLDATWTAGSATSGPALGTIDLPIALAVLNLNPVPSNITYLLAKSISGSSLSGDEALYSFLGNGEEAATRTNAVLRAYGDQNTTVATSTARQDVPAFSQTDWPVAPQAQMAGQLWCSSDAWYAVSRMHYFDDDHAYGFGSVVDSYLRTSDGVDDNGNPVVRQMAIIPNANGDRIGVGLVVNGARDKLDDVKAAADAVAGRVYFGAVGFDGGHC